jgi:hypothetical protein
MDVEEYGTLEVMESSEGHSKVIFHGDVLTQGLLPVSRANEKWQHYQNVIDDYFFMLEQEGIFPNKQSISSKAIEWDRAIKQVHEKLRKIYGKRRDNLGEDFHKINPDDVVTEIQRLYEIGEWKMKIPASDTVRKKITKWNKPTKKAK